MLDKLSESFRTRGRAVALAFGILAGAATISAPSADAFSLGAFDYYGILINNGAKGGDINTFPVNANIGIGDITAQVNLHNGVVNGQVDCSQVPTPTHSVIVANPAITGTQPISLGGAPTPAAVNYGVASVQAAITDALNLSTTYGAKSGNPITIAGGTVNATDGRFDPATGAYIFTTSTFNFPGGHPTLTINGTASDNVVINVTGDSGHALDGGLALTGGITPDNVIVNFIGSGGSVQGAGGNLALNATFLIPNLAVTLSSNIINGHIFGGGAGTNFQFVSNTFINQPPLQPPAPPVPIPASALLMLSGTGFIGSFRFFWRRQRPLAG